MDPNNPHDCPTLPEKNKDLPGHDVNLYLFNLQSGKIESVEKTGEKQWKFSQGSQIVPLSAVGVSKFELFWPLSGSVSFFLPFLQVPARSGMSSQSEQQFELEFFNIFQTLKTGCTLPLHTPRVSS